VLTNSSFSELLLLCVQVAIKALAYAVISCILSIYQQLIDHLIKMSFQTC